jgi:hypothetical protein
MPKFRNIHVHDLELTVAGFLRRVASGDVIDVPDEEAEGLASQVGQPDSKWEAVGAAAKQAVKTVDAPVDPAVKTEVAK